MHGDTYRQELHDLGVAMNFAFAQPKRLRQFLSPPRAITSADVPAQLRIPRKRGDR